MKKNFWKISLLAVVTAALLLGATGCQFPNAKLAMPPESAVLSNGGSAVQYGDYVYFINGTVPGFTDPNAKANVWGDVVKGGIARVKLEGSGGIVTKKTENYNADASLKKEIEIIDTDINKVEMVVPKFITFSNDVNAGIFIYDGFIYYGSPGNRKDKNGNVQTHLTEFYRTKLDGTGTTRLYTSEEAIKSYNFYYYQNKVYLVTFEGDKLNSLVVSGGRKPVRTVLDDDITDVYFPRKEEWKKDINTDTASDFVYYTRPFDPKKGDMSANGTVLECRRPDLDIKTSLQIKENNNTYAIVSVEGDTLFYYETVFMSLTAGEKKLKAQTGIYDMAYNMKLLEEGKETGLRDIRPAADIIVGVTDAMTQVVPFNGNISQFTQENGKYSEVTSFYAAVVEGAEIKLYTEGRLPATLANGSVIYKVADKNGIKKDYGNGEVFFSDGSALCSVSVSFDSVSKVIITKGPVVSGDNFNPDVAGGLFWFLGSSLNQKDFDIELRTETVSANYMFVKPVFGADNQADEYFLGILSEDELPEEEE